MSETYVPRYRIPRALLLRLTQSGIDLEALAKTAGLNPQRLSELLPSAQRDVFLAGAASRLPPGSGLSIGLTAPIELLGLTGLAVMSCSTVSEALALLARRVPAMTGDAMAMVPRIGQTAVRFFPVEKASYARQTVERELSFVLGLVRRLTGKPASPVYASFAFARPEYHTRYGITFGCPVHFDQPVNEVCFKDSDLAGGVVTSNPDLEAIFRVQAEEEALIQDSSAHIEARARAALRGALFGHAPDAPELARLLRVPDRELSEGLKRAGTSFRTLLDQVRRERALLATRQPPSRLRKQIAFLVGVDPRNLDRYFRIWTGMTLGAYQQASQLGGDAADIRAEPPTGETAT
ncbi:AraC family transcriptional regulator [Pendulispora brunnea]|uniref:AraC family transcriptional regulator n=1 Tax=Pendulispora brunnea TaxID=2905690 RepID=A0ABZ2KDN5_9BACT